jgi:hypothetical protein
MPDVFKPNHHILKMVPKDAPVNYKQGWIDGCKSGMGNMTNTTHRTFWRTTQNPLLRKDPVYYKMWKDTFTFCRHYIYGIVRQHDVRMTLQNNRSGSIWTGPFDNVLTKSMLNMWGPGTAGQFFTNFGNVGGDGFFTKKSAMTWDWSGDSLYTLPGLGGTLNMSGY